VSHLLEDKLTERASGNLGRLFDSVPSRATLVEVDEDGGAPRAASATEVRARRIGAHENARARCDACKRAAAGCLNDILWARPKGAPQAHCASGRY
jgi:hypothetical protein